MSWPRVTGSFETLDLDRIGVSMLEEVVGKIEARGCVVLDVFVSGGLDGFNVTLDCRCGACRLVWDDDRRFAWDMGRPVHMRNVLFNLGRSRKLYLDR